MDKSTTIGHLFSGTRFVSVWIESKAKARKAAEQNNYSSNPLKYVGCRRIKKSKIKALMHEAISADSKHLGY